MEPTKSLESTLRAANAESDAVLAFKRRHWGRALQYRWRSVKPAATTLLAFAYAPLSRKRQSQAGIRRQLGEVLDYPGRGRMLQEDSREAVRLSERDLKRVHTEVRRALAALVLAPAMWGAEWSKNPRLIRAVLDGATARRNPGPCGQWRVPRGTFEIRYARIREDAIIALDRIEPPSVRVLHAAGNVLTDAVAWLRCCELCGRVFFKTRRQRVCSLQCKGVFYGRKTTADPTERRGRRRRDYLSETWREHAAWFGGGCPILPAKRVPRAWSG